MRAIIFDLDGTLVDSSAGLTLGLNHWLESLGRRPLSKTEVEGMIGEGVGPLMLRALGATGEPEPYEPHLRAFRRAYDAVAADHSPPYPGVDALLRRWAARVPLALCTNKPEAPARAILARHGWTRLFSAVIGGDSCPTQKPEPGMVRACLEAMDVSAGQSRYVGDSPTDASAAIAAGVPLALMTWGYSPHDVSTLGAQAVLDSAAGLDRWLAQ